jgi:hypothetical protein
MLVSMLSRSVRSGREQLEGDAEEGGWEMKPAVRGYQGYLIVKTAPLLVADRLQFLMSELASLW